MTATQYRYLEPVDVLFFRSNRLFGGPGSYGASMVPPWPSVAAGSIRSRILVDDRIDLAAFAAGQVAHPRLGTPAQPGTFRLTDFRPARRDPSGDAVPLFSVPADLAVSETDGGDIEVRCLHPRPLSTGLATSSPLPQLAILAQAERRKAVTGYWLNAAGWGQYLAGCSIDTKAHLINESELWALEQRVGVGLDAATRSAEDGKLFTAQAVALRPGVGFLVGALGADVPECGLMRFGGDGRVVTVHDLPGFQALEPDYAAVSAAGRCRIVLTSPGIFEDGWRLPGLGSDQQFRLGEVRGKLVAAAVQRAQIVSGWNLATRRPKPAERAVPAGSVYWLDDLEAEPEALRKLVEQGLWRGVGDNAIRQAEGFNRFTFAVAQPLEY